MSLCVQVCVYRMRMAPHSDSPLVGKTKRERERGWESGRMDKKDRVQSSEADDCVFAAGVHLFIADATEISIEMISATDFAQDISDGRRPNVYVYRAGARERDGAMWGSDGAYVAQGDNRRG